MAHQHVVKFFEHEPNLYATVGRFIAEGLASGQPGLVIATPPHRAGILRTIAEHLSPAACGARLGDLVMVDAESTLGRFMAGDHPDPARFMQIVAGLVDGVTRTPGSRPVRAYGEMVDILWQAGGTEATIELEHLWNAAAAAHDLCLLCSYSVHHISADMDRLQRVCCLHTAVLSPSQVTNPLGSAT